VSLGIVVLSPSGIVLAADSRLSLDATLPGGQTLSVTYDNATKLLRFNEPNNYVGAITYGQAVIPTESRTAESYLPEFEASLKSKTRLSIDEFAQALSDFYADQWKPAVTAGYSGPDMVFQLAGYDDKAAYGRSFQFELPSKPKPIEEIPAGAFGIRWGGQTDMVDRMIKGYGLRLPAKVVSTLKLNHTQKSQLEKLLQREEWALPVHVMALQDCVSLVLALMRSTVTMQQLAITQRGVGGPVDLITITRTEGRKEIQFKEVYGEDRYW
jgi:hypothetical protein